MANYKLKSSSSQEKHHELEVLYEISKVIANFETLDQTFSKVSILAAEAHPLRASVLIENRGGSVNRTVWRSYEVSQGQLNEATRCAKIFYEQFVGSPPLQVIPSLDRNDFIGLPLVVSRRPPFGVLLLYGRVRMDKRALAFMDALTNLIAVAVDRFYTASNVVELRERHISDLESERELRESFVSILTHDLRNPLGAAKLSAELILRSGNKRAKQIISSIDRVDHMIGNLLDANRIRAGERMPLKIQLFNLRELLKTTIDDLSVTYGDRVVLAEGQDVCGYWSRDEIRRAMENLINNAVKYGAPLRPVTVSLRQTERTIIIDVHNEGVPIPQEDLTHLFQRFRRTKTSQTSIIRGWGLGLTLVLGMVEAHGGTVKVESEPSKGTTFTLELPKDARPLL